jgi:bacterioferritin-associated ferredoxin
MYVCLCNALTDQDISQAAARGARSVDEAYQMFGTDVCCGQCTCMAQDIIDSTEAPLYGGLALQAAE